MPIVLPALLEGVALNPANIARSLILLMLIPLALGLAQGEARHSGEAIDPVSTVHLKRAGAVGRLTPTRVP